MIYHRAAFPPFIVGDDNGSFLGGKTASYVTELWHYVCTPRSDGPQNKSSIAATMINDAAQMRRSREWPESFTSTGHSYCGHVISSLHTTV